MSSMIEYIYMYDIISLVQNTNCIPTWLIHYLVVWSFQIYSFKRYTILTTESLEKDISCLSCYAFIQTLHLDEII